MGTGPIGMATKVPAAVRAANSETREMRMSNFGVF